MAIEGTQRSGAGPDPTGADGSAARIHAPRLLTLRPEGRSPERSRPDRSLVPDGPLYFIKDERGMVRLDPLEIRLVQAEGNYVSVQLPGRSAVLRNSLAEVLKMLPAGILVRINRSQAVNIHHVGSITADEVHVDGRVFSLSRGFREAVLGGLKIIGDR